MLEAFSLDGRVALITGGNGGIGLAIAEGFKAAGASVAIAGRDAAKNDLARQGLGSESERLQLDVRDEAAVESAVARVVERFGQIDVLVNCAGSFQGGSLVEMTLDAWNDVLGSHLTGSFLCSKYAAKAMIAAGSGGKIVNVGSMYSLFGAPDFCDYASAKTGLLGLTRSLAVELGRHDIQVNAILPGWYETDLTRGMPSTPLGEEIRRRTPLGRWGELRNLVGAAVFLASPASDFVTGVCIPIDGGYSVSDRLLNE